MQASTDGVRATARWEQMEEKLITAVSDFPILYTMFSELLKKMNNRDKQFVGVYLSENY